MADITHAISSLYPTASWQIVGEDYTTLEWYGTHIPKPSLAILMAEVERLNSTTGHIEPRRAEYPPITDYLDAVYWQSQGDDTKMTAYLAAVEAVKSKYPKGNA
jgi:hypothetical protein